MQKKKLNKAAFGAQLIKNTFGSMHLKKKLNSGY